MGSSIGKSAPEYTEYKSSQCSQPNNVPANIPASSDSPPLMRTISNWDGKKGGLGTPIDNCKQLCDNDEHCVAYYTQPCKEKTYCNGHPPETLYCNLFSYNNKTPKESFYGFDNNFPSKEAFTTQKNYVDFKYDGDNNNKAQVTVNNKTYPFGTTSNDDNTKINNEAICYIKKDYLTLADS